MRCKNGRRSASMTGEPKEHEGRAEGGKKEKEGRRERKQ
jgi:hypothetical protein